MDQNIEKIVTEAMDVLHRSAERKEGPTRARAMNGDEKAAAIVRQWNEEDTGIEFPAYMPDGTDVKTLSDVAAMMGVERKDAAYRVLNEPELDPMLYLEAKMMIGDPEADTYDETVCIMAVPSPRFARFIAGHFEAMVPTEELHVTLAFLGDKNLMTTEERERLAEVVRETVAFSPITDASITGFARFVAGEGKPDPIVLLISSAELGDLRNRLMDNLVKAHLDMYVSRRFGFIPHMTLGYAPKVEDHMVRNLTEPIPIDFDTVLLADGADHTHIPIPKDVRQTPAEAPARPDAPAQPVRPS